MTVNLGIIGLGGVASYHLESFTKLEHVRVKAVCDLHGELARRVASSCGAGAYTDYLELLERERLDAVYLLVPAFARAEIEAAVIARGLPMMVEKPVGVTAEAPERTLEALKRTGLINAVAYQWRYAEATDAARAVLEQRPAGLALGYWLDRGHAGSSWQADPARSGGQSNEQTTHIIDLARFLLGEVTEVYAARTRRTPERAAAREATVLTLSFAGGAIATLSSAAFLDHKGKAGLDLVTPEGVLELRLDRLTERRNGEASVARYDKFSARHRLNAAFMEAVKRDDPTPIRASYEEGYKTLQVVLAAERSLSRHQPVRLGADDDAPR